MTCWLTWKYILTHTVNITAVEGHAFDKDAAAGLGRGRFAGEVLDARRAFFQACHLWYPIVLELHRYFIVVARTVADHEIQFQTRLYGLLVAQPKGHVWRALRDYAPLLKTDSL